MKINNKWCLDELGIIPGSMGAKSFIVKGNPQSFCSCAHGAGRKMSRTAAKRQFSESDVSLQTEGVECRKDKGIIDEIPAAYKDIDQVMRHQSIKVIWWMLCIPLNRLFV